MSIGSKFNRSVVVNLKPGFLYIYHLVFYLETIGAKSSSNGEKAFNYGRKFDSSLTKYVLKSVSSKKIVSLFKILVCRRKSMEFEWKDL